MSAAAQSIDGNAEVQLQAVRAISERNCDEAVPLLIKMPGRIRIKWFGDKQFVLLGESGDPRAVDFFREVLTK